MQQKRVAMGTDEQGRPTRYMWTEAAPLPSQPSYSVSYQTNDLNLNAEQVDKLAVGMANTFEKAMPGIGAAIVLGAVVVHLLDFSFITTPMILGGAGLLGIIVLLTPRGIEWYYKAKLVNRIITRYDGTTTSIVSQGETATPARESGGIAYTAPKQLTPLEELEVLLRYVLKRCYLVTCSSPRPEQKPYKIVPIINKQLTPKLHRRAITILQDFGLITYSKERQRREVILGTEAEAQTRLTQLLPKLRTIDLASVERRADIEQEPS